MNQDTTLNFCSLALIAFIITAVNSTNHQLHQIQGWLQIDTLQVTLRSGSVLRIAYSIVFSQMLKAGRPALYLHGFLYEQVGIRRLTAWFQTPWLPCSVNMWASQNGNCCSAFENLHENARQWAHEEMLFLISSCSQDTLQSSISFLDSLFPTWLPCEHTPPALARSNWYSQSCSQLQGLYQEMTRTLWQQHPCPPVNSNEQRWITGKWDAC